MDIYSLIETHVVNQMTPVITLTSIETIAGTPVKYKLFSCNTQWVTINDKITIDGVVYRVVSFVQDEYLIVTGASAPVQLYFQLTAPTFEHGTHRRVSSERVKKSASKRTITPMIYALPIKGKTRPSIDSMYGFSGKVRFFCLTTFDKNGDASIATQQKNVVNPMSALVRYFIQKFEERLDLFEEIQEVFQDDFMDFGDPAIWGAKERIFEEFLSGVGVNFDLNIYSQDECCTDNPAVSCLPVKFKIEGVLAETLPSGDTFNLNLIDTDGNIPTHTYNAATDTLEVPAPGGSASIDIAVNGTPFYTGVSTNQDIPVINSADTPIGQPDGANYRIGDSELNINDNFEELIPAETIFDLYVEDTSGDPAGDYIGANTVQIDDSLITLITQAVPYALTPLRAEQPKSLSIIDEIDFDPIQVTVASDTEGAAEFVIPNGEVLVKDSAGNTLHTKVVKAGGSANQTVSDGSIILQNGNGDTLQTYTNKAQEAKVVVLPIIYLRPKPSLSSVSSIDGDDYWYKLNNPDTYVPAVVGIPALLDPSTPHKLRYKNAFGHLWRRTGINGGYYDIDTAEYKLADGTVSTQAVTFGFGADAYFIDHHTGLGYRWSLVGGGTTHAANFATAEAATYAGFNDWMICSIEEHMSLWVSLPNINFQFPQDPNYYPMVWNSPFRFRSNHPSAPSTSMRVYTSGNYSTGLISVSNAWLPVRRHYT
jgi:hypothetical protein